MQSVAIELLFWNEVSETITNRLIKYHDYKLEKGTNPVFFGEVKKIMLKMYGISHLLN